jgi:tRNA threonylcarbamoyladenosine biosynthesis protein TsaE
MRAGFVIESESAAETEALGRCAGQEASAGLIFCLRGELGAGKTVFARGLAAGHLGPGQAAVTSPTYVLEHVYRSGRNTVYHLDLYRLTGGAADFENAGLSECLREPQGVVCIEWAERIEQLLPDDRLEIEFEHLGPERRRVHLLATGPRSAKLVDALVARVGTRERLVTFQNREAGPPSAQAWEPSMRH